MWVQAKEGLLQHCSPIKGWPQRSAVRGNPPNKQRFVKCVFFVCVEVARNKGTERLMSNAEWLCCIFKGLEREILKDQG